MKTVYGIGNVKTVGGPVALAMGVFDGVHVGHQAVILKTVQQARAVKGVSVVLTFHPHPVLVLHPQVRLSYLVSLAHRLKLIEELGVDVCVVEPFNRKFSRQHPEQFVKTCLVDRLHVEYVFVGDDFRFGYHREGRLGLFQSLGQKYGFEVDVVSEVKKNKNGVSSTLLRRWIAEGRLKEARRMLGRRFSLMGRVTRGDGRGRELGYPTANLKLESDVLPPSGVYLVNAYWRDNRYPALANVGHRPTFHRRGESPHVEVHLLDFHRNIYEQTVIVEFIKKIRDEKKFSSPQALIRRIHQDERRARTFFKLRFC